MNIEGENCVQCSACCYRCSSSVYLRISPRVFQDEPRARARSCICKAERAHQAKKTARPSPPNGGRENNVQTNHHQTAILLFFTHKKESPRTNNNQEVEKESFSQTDPSSFQHSPESFRFFGVLFPPSLESVWEAGERTCDIRYLSPRDSLRDRGGRQRAHDRMVQITIQIDLCISNMSPFEDL